ncbi:YraN family protein [Campylobacter sp.]|uniref:YraN family protein n=1 Tax=Campylobacter sp. TaxID=205 RepID=UPI0027097919|nr:YraN family protein [Campylobacter sp.]
MGLSEYLFGKVSENDACKFLKKEGCEILERNFSCKFGEIDIVAKKDEILHFIEVKATKGDYEAAYRLTLCKMQKILKTVDYYLLKNGFNNDFQIDLITIEGAEVSWIKNISL